MSEDIAIWGSDGITKLSGKKAERVELRAGVMEWLRQFNDVARALGMGLHCSKCKADIIGKNADTDRVFAVSCGCREFIGPNRDYREPPPTRAH